MLDHVTLRTGDLEGTRVFLEAVLGLTPGYRPPFNFPGYWLYSGGEPIVHLIPGHGKPAGRDTEVIDHAGFRLTDYTGTLDKLSELGIPSSKMDLPDLGERRLFVTTPGKIVLELIFRDDIDASNVDPLLEI